MLPELRGRPAREIEFVIVRELVEGDREALANPTAPAATPLQTIKSQHHQLAQVMARGATRDEAALITGFSPGRITQLAGDPMFTELLEHYRAVDVIGHVDVLERLRMLGLGATEELLRRLDETPEKLTPGQLMELVDLGLMRGRASPGGTAAAPGAPGGAGVTISVKFVAPSAEPASTTIDSTAEEYQQ